MKSLSQRLRGASVAIVDDDPESIELFSVVLEQAGAVVHAATRAEEALSRVAKWRPAVVVIDIAMPVMDGLTLLREIRRLRPLRETPAIAISGWGAARNREAALAAGFQEYLEKPLDPIELATRVAALVDANASA